MPGEVYHPTTPESYRRMQNLAGVILSVVARTTVLGREHIPAGGPLLVTVNHLSMFDPPLLLVTCPLQGVIFVTSKHKRNPIIAAVVRRLGCIWVERGEADRAAVRAAVDVLKSGMVVGIAPEGTRSLSHALQPGKSGTAYLATRANAPILPAVVWGVEAIKKSLPRLRRPQVFVRYGPVFSLPENPRANSEALEGYTTEIMCRLAALLPEKYRGAYATHPRVAELAAI